MTDYVRVIRTDTDIETGYGPFESADQAQSFADGLNNRLDLPEWFDSAEVIDHFPTDGCRRPRC